MLSQARAPPERGARAAHHSSRAAQVVGDQGVRTAPQSADVTTRQARGPTVHRIRLWREGLTAAIAVLG